LMMAAMPEHAGWWLYINLTTYRFVWCVCKTVFGGQWNISITYYAVCYAVIRLSLLLWRFSFAQRPPREMRFE
jgi:hypothetical protein